jgi:hypothetical protein
MAALVTQNVGTGGAITTQAAAGGGDTAPVGRSPGGWFLEPSWLHCVIGGTSTTVTVGGVAFGPFTNTTLIVPINVGTKQGATTTITYNQVTGVSVAAVRFARVS